MRARRIRGVVTTIGAAMLVAGLLVGPGHAQVGQVPVDLPGDVEIETLTTDTVDPTAVDVTPDGRVVFAERDGVVKVWHQDGTLQTAAEFDVAACGFDCTGDPSELEEGGIHGLLLDRDFARTRKLYLYYSVAGSYDETTGDGLFRLSTFVLGDDSVLDLTSEQVILENPAEWATCCHYGGDLEWRADGTLLLSTGDDTSPRDEGWNPRDKREGREAFDADRTAQNPADRRGKILRLAADGSVPADNPHVDDPAFDPYVYAMGFRSNYRIGYDPVTDVVVVGNVGPDAATPDDARGPEGHDEFEVVPSGGGTNHGWPHCIADNRAYQDYDYETQTSQGPLSCEGMTPAQIFYPYGPTAEFPLVQSGPRSATAGPVYRYDGDGALALPDAYQGQALLMDWARDNIWHVPVSDEGELEAGRMGVLTTSVKHPIDAKVGPDGAVYLVEYGEFYYDNGTSEISRMTCAGCQPDAADYDPLPNGDPAPEPAPAPEPDPDPEPGAAPDAGQDDPPLPTTGGGLALAGAALLGLGSIRWRRTV